MPTNTPTKHKAPPPAVNITEALKEGSPLQALMGEVLEEVGGVDFVKQWAREYPNEFMRVLVAVTPVANATPRGASQNTVNLNIHPSLQSGPLDVVADQ